MCVRGSDERAALAGLLVAILFIIAVCWLIYLVPD